MGRPLTSAGPHARPVYAIVVNYNGWRDTIECLKSLLASDHDALQVIVCDNGSTDDSIHRIREWAARAGPDPMRLEEVSRARLEGGHASGADVVLVECGENLGFAGANNVASRYALGREADAYLLLFNNDAIVAPDAIRLMVATAERDTGIGAVGATIYSYAERHRIEALGGATLSRFTGMVAMNVPPTTDAGEPRIDYVTGCCVLVPRRALERVGLMDERYFLYGEDADWGLRFTAAGLRLTHCADARVWHKGGGTVVHRSPLHDYYTVRGGLLLVHKHFPFMLPIALLHSAARTLLPKLLRGEWARLAAALRGHRDFIRYAIRPSRTASAP